MTAPTYEIQTASGRQTIDSAHGYVLPHEHVLVDVRVWWEGPGEWDDVDHDEPSVVNCLDQLRSLPQAVTRENMVLSDWYVASKELSAARRSGCGLLVDLTTEGLDPQPGLVMRAAELAGIDIVFGVGRYLADTLAEAEREASAEELADKWTMLASGETDGWHRGIIGEIGTSEELAPCEVVSLQAAVLVQQRTGLAINVHLHPYARQALTILRILEETGADLSRVALSHCDGELDIDWLERVLASGCYVEMDMFGTGPDRLVQGRGYPSDNERADAVQILADRGWLDRLLLSHDICHRNSLATFGGWGYSHLATEVQPKLAGLMDHDSVLHIMRTNPLRLLGLP